MEKLFPPLSAHNSTNTTAITKQKMGCSQNSQFPSTHNNKPLTYLSNSSNSYANMSPPQGQAALYNYPFCYCQRSWLFHPNRLPIDQERRVLDAYKTKIARSKRKLARQRSLNKNSSFSSPNSNQVDSRKEQNSQSSINRDLYKFCTPDNKRLRMLLMKELKNSDVGSLGRVVLPKREAEENLPTLSDKDGIQVVIRDVYSSQEWSLRFKYWSNNKSRMYVLENTGDFARQNGLESGDTLTLYEDESKNLYFSVKKVEKAVEDSTNQSYTYMQNVYQGRDEEEASLALLIEQLKHKEQQEAEEANSLVTLSMEIPPTSNYRHKEEDKFNTMYPQPASMDHFTNDDCYTGLGLLPDVNRFNFSL